MSKCIICEAKTSGSLEFCKVHYHEHKDDILLKKPWVRVLKNDEQRLRRQRKREYEDVSLDQIIDSAFLKRER